MARKIKVAVTTASQLLEVYDYDTVTGDINNQYIGAYGGLKFEKENALQDLTGASHLMNIGFPDGSETGYFTIADVQSVTVDGVAVSVATLAAFVTATARYMLPESSQLSGFGDVVAASGTTTPLAAGATFTGTSFNASGYASVTVAAKTDQDGTLYIEFSPDGTNWDSSLSFNTTAGTNEVHRLSVTRSFCRVRFTNTSAAPQTYLRLQTIGGNQTALTSALNSTIQSDADALTVRPLDFNLMVAESLYQNRTNTIKDGLNADIDTATVPEDITNEGGVYAGFPLGAVEAGEIVVGGADTGTVYYSYLASSTSTDYVFGSKAIAGAGTYALGHNIWRCNFAYFVSSNPAAFNVGAITIRNTPTVANVFCVIDIGFSQSYCAAYTVPYGSSIFFDRITGNLRGSATGSMDGYFWYRTLGESPRLRFPFELQFGTLYFDDVDYLIRVPQQTDIIPRVTVASANNLSAKISYRLIKVKS